MKLHEFQTKAIFKREGIPLPASFLSSSPVQAKQAASEIGYPVILKAQSLISGRGKAGGIRLTRNDAETESAAGDIFNIKLKGISIQQILVEKAIKVENEFLSEYATILLQVIQASFYRLKAVSALRTMHHYLHQTVLYRQLTLYSVCKHFKSDKHVPILK